MLFSAVAATPPIQFGPYLLTERVGQGGMAVVYKATRHGPSGFAKTVVVKAMLPGLSSRQEFVAMFSAEARLMAQLHHPNIVQVHDFGICEGVPYLAMEYLAGRNLSQLRAAVSAIGQRVPVGAALAIAREVSHGLAYAHDFVDVEGRRRQIIHRDVSPSNVMVCRDGSVKLLDFGVAKIVGQFDFDVTQSVKGKYAYMAPEQVTKKPIDRRVDVFALGVVLWELLTSKRLFAADSELETLQRVAAARVTAPSLENREVPRVLDAIVLKALACDVTQRYASGAELAEALETLDSLAWSRKRLSTWVDQLFSREWQVVCEVCGKPVTVGAACAECGTRGSEASRPVEVGVHLGGNAAAPAADPPSDEAQTLMGASKTDKNVIDDGLAPLEPTRALEPAPLPLPPTPTPPTPRKPRLAVVRTPVPRPAADPPPIAPAPPPPPVGAPSLSLVPPRPRTPLPPPTQAPAAQPAPAPAPPPLPTQPKLPQPASQPKVVLGTTSQPKLPGVALPPAKPTPTPSPSHKPPVQPVHGRTSQPREPAASEAREPNAPVTPTTRARAVSGSIGRDTPTPPPFVPPTELLPKPAPPEPPVGPKLPVAMPLVAPAPNPSFVPVALRAALFDTPGEVPTLAGAMSPATSRLSRRLASPQPPRSSRLLLTLTALMLALALAGALAVSLRGPQRIEPVDVLSPMPTTGAGATERASDTTAGAATPAAPAPGAAASPSPAEEEARAVEVRTVDAEHGAAADPPRKRHRSSRSRSSSPSPASPDSDRTVKDGRIVDPFASMK